MNEIAYKGEVGRVIGQTTNLDWTGWTAKQVIFMRPDNTTVTKTGADVIVDDIKTGQIHVVSAGGDLTITGEYLMQAKVTIGTTILFGPLTSFIVEDVLV